VLLYFTVAIAQNVVDDVEHVGHHEPLARAGGRRLQVFRLERLQRRAQVVVQRR
jgi:hypothetical protein